MRIMIFGRPGSGKSTFAFALAQKLHLPLHHLDRHFFTARWIEHDYQEFLAIQQNLVNQEQWIIEGNSLQSIEMRYACAHICIYLNYPRWLCFFRLVKRLFKKDSAIKDRPEKCDERISWMLIKYTWTFEYRLNNRLIKDLERLQKTYPQVEFYTVQNDHNLVKVMEALIKKNNEKNNHEAQSHH